MFSDNDTKLEESKRFYENGQLKERGSHRNGRLKGDRKYWYGNGQPWVQEFYRDGKREGKRKFWHRNGQLWAREFYRNGRLEGEYRGWGHDGQLVVENFDRHGKLIDPHFNRIRKKRFLRMRRCLRNYVDLFDSFIISDLAIIVCL